MSIHLSVYSDANDMKKMDDKGRWRIGHERKEMDA